MGREYFFYTDPTKVKPQVDGQQFGPSQEGDPSLPETDSLRFDKYQITNLHYVKDGESALAIAICNGTIRLQEDSPTTYSIILKPNYQPPFDFPYVKYFIYKGVKLHSIVKGTSIKFSKRNEIPFIKDIYDSWKDQEKPTTNITDSKNALGLVYKAGV